MDNSLPDCKLVASWLGSPTYVAQGVVYHTALSACGQIQVRILSVWLGFGLSKKFGLTEALRVYRAVYYSNLAPKFLVLARLRPAQALDMTRKKKRRRCAEKKTRKPTRTHKPLGANVASISVAPTLPLHLYRA